jgi:exosortase/archaeosortase family protein
VTNIDQPSTPALPWDEPEPVRGHFVVGIALIALAAFLMIEQNAFKAVEASVTAWVLQFFTAGGTASADDVVYYGLGTHSVNGLQITTLCSTVILVTPLLALAGVMLMVPRFRLTYVARGLLTGLVLVILCNFLRYCSAALAMQLAGREGFDVIHRYLGSILVILGFAAAFILLLRIGVNGRLRKRRSGEPD